MKTNLTILIFVIMTTWQCCVGPPVSKNKHEEESAQDNDGLELMMHYHRYLKEVVGALESDPEFKKKLEAADEADIRSGKIAHELEFVSHHVRTRLDEIKRQELERLKSLVKQQQQLTENEVIDDPNHGHLDHANPHTFEIEDLKKLIAKTTEDLAEADRKRREEFKQYELQKEYEKQEKLNHTNGDEREKLEKQFKELEERHKKHKPLHEPGHKAQLEEVWEEQDHMQQEFDPKTFFMLHDLDSNGLWDQDEVKALFIKELDKMYAQGAPEDDMRERVEEMERMRETVFQEVDTNRDGFIDFHEFLTQTKKQDFKEDNGWKGLDEQKPYSDEELEAYIRQQQMMHAPPPGYYPPPGAYHPNQVPPGGYHPNQVPPAYHQQPQYQHQPQFQHHPAQGANPQLNTNEIYSNQVHPAQQQQLHQQQLHQQQQFHQQQQQLHQQQQQQQNYQPNPPQAQVNPGQAVPQQGQQHYQTLAGGNQQHQEQGQPQQQQQQPQPPQQQQQPQPNQVNPEQPNNNVQPQAPPQQNNQLNSNQGQPQVQQA